MNEIPSSNPNPEFGEVDESFFTRLWSSPEEALRASQAILDRYGCDSEIVRRHRFTPVNVPFEM
jgi:hypothetical protein